MIKKIQVYGLDFTSAPAAAHSQAKRKKSLLLASGILAGQVVSVSDFTNLNGSFTGDFSRFEQWLETPGPWIAGLDFPFGQPLGLLEQLQWPTDWNGYIREVSLLGKTGFEQTLTAFKAAQPKGQKELRRQTDILAGALSPMKLFGIPVGKMFYQGAIRLARSSCAVHPMRVPAAADRHLFEVYPALIVRACLGRVAYKSEQSQSDPQGRKQRARLLALLSEPGSLFHCLYGITCRLSSPCRRLCLEDESGDTLDSLLCLLQAAWCASQGAPIRPVVPPVFHVEGLIYDPSVKIF